MKEFDAVIVLACGINEDGSLPTDPKESVDIAAELYAAQKTPLIIFSGNLSYKAIFTPPRTESETMKAYAEEIGIPPEDILIENNSKDTLGNAYFTKVNYLMPRNLGRLAVILGPNHSLKRVKFIFDKVLGKEFTISYIEHNAQRSGEDEREQKSFTVLKEWLADVRDGDHEAIYRVMLNKHPGYSSHPEIAQNGLGKRTAS